MVPRHLCRLVLLAPAFVRLHRAAGAWGPVALAAGAVAVDIARFHFRIAGIEWLNLVLVWGFAHQLGFLWLRLSAGSRRTAWCLVLAGLAGLVVLTNLGSYPRSMVGVPGEAFSNMGPPTVCILALTLVQVGVVLLARSRVTTWLERPLPRRFTAWAGARSMTVYLWHFPAFALAYGAVSWVGITVPQVATRAWWLQRPLWVVAPGVLTHFLLRTVRRAESAVIPARQGHQP